MAQQRAQPEYALTLDPKREAREGSMALLETAKGNEDFGAFEELALAVASLDLPMVVKLVVFFFGGCDSVCVVGSLMAR